MDSHTLFRKGIDAFNSWYKIKYLTDAKCNADAYKSFDKAKNLFIMNRNSAKTKECFKWMIKCVETLNECDFCDPELLYENYADFLKDSKIGFKMEVILNYDKALKIQEKRNNVRKIINIKEKVAAYYKSINDFNCAIMTQLEILRLRDDDINKLKTYNTLFELHTEMKDYKMAIHYLDEMIKSNGIADNDLYRYIFDVILCHILHNYQNAICVVNMYTIRNLEFKFDYRYGLILFIIDVENIEEFDELLNNRKFNAIETKLLNEIRKILVSLEYTN
jgi:pentatricopeptide repeat protein